MTTPTTTTKETPVEDTSGLDETGIAMLGLVGDPYPLRVYDISSAAIDVAVESGLVNQWADVLEYRRGSLLRLKRWDTDGISLEIRTKDVRRAVRRVGRERPDELSIDEQLAAEIADAVTSGGDVPPAIADALIQIAATGRVQY